MKGETVKNIILGMEYSVAQVAEMIGTSQQNLASALKHEDVRSGLLEKIASALNVPLSTFYGGTFGPVQSVGDNNTQITQVAGNYSAPDSNILEILKMKDEQLLLTIKQVSKAQEQMDRVLDRFGGATSSEDPEGV
ncbi:MAG: helix-turn-helix transcriptional regulator [Paludibacteraceae bacterium]|nr:helix-turn-helix transcriptional regulator [Paludibacteraceae bacterium]